MNKKTSIGGQALLEGILMRGPEMTRLVVRKPNGELEIKDEQKGTTKKNPLAKVPFIRGVEIGRAHV